MGEQKSVLRLVQKLLFRRCSLRRNQESEYQLLTSCFVKALVWWMKLSFLTVLCDFTFGLQFLPSRAVCFQVLADKFHTFTFALEFMGKIHTYEWHASFPDDFLSWLSQMPAPASNYNYSRPSAWQHLQLSVPWHTQRSCFVFHCFSFAKGDALICTPLERSKHCHHAGPSDCTLPCRNGKSSCASAVTLCGWFASYKPKKW